MTILDEHTQLNEEQSAELQAKLNALDHKPGTVPITLIIELAEILVTVICRLVNKRPHYQVKQAWNRPRPMPADLQQHMDQDTFLDRDGALRALRTKGLKELRTFKKRKPDGFTVLRMNLVYRYRLGDGTEASRNLDLVKGVAFDS